MNRFTSIIRSRLHPGIWALGVITLIYFLQQNLTDSIAITKTTPPTVDQFISDDVQYFMWQCFKVATLGAAVLFWIANRNKAMRTALMLSTFLLTVELCSSVFLLVSTLGSTLRSELPILIRDTIIVMCINVLIFSIWYWLIDAPSLRDLTNRNNQSWELLFPQRANAIPGFEAWHPRYPDYLFLAIITTTTFGPADTLPLTTRAKMLMGLQVLIAFLTLSLLAGRVLALMGT